MEKEKFVSLSQTQLGIYLDCVKRGKGTYNSHFLYTLDNDIDMKRLAAAIEKAVAAHPYMNVRIVERDGEPMQYIPDSFEPYSQTVTEMTEEEWKREMPRLISTPLELMGGRLFRFDLVQTEKAKYFLRTTHHIAFDGTASNVLFSDIAAAYNELEVTSEGYNSLDAARDETEKRNGSEYETAKKWYDENFSGLDTESLPLPDVYGKPDSFKTFVHDFPLNYDEMRNFCREHKISASALTSAAFGFTLGVYTHQREALFSTIYHGRKDERTAKIIGMFVKTMPVFCRWDSDTKTTDLLTALSVQISESRENDLFSFADLNRICPMNDKPMFAYHGMIRTTSTFCGLPCQDEILDSHATGYPLEVELMGETNGMKLHISYNAGKYSHDFIDTFARTYENVLQQMMSREYVRDIEPTNEKQLGVLDGFNNTDNPYDATQTIVSLFRKAASENADRTAVIFNEKKLTYKELDEITERIAGTIASKGLGRGDVVSILIPRGEYMPIASIGALKAGCAYQPLDPTYPPERLNFMIKDSGAKLLITTEELRPLITDYSGDVLMVSEIPTLPACGAELPPVKPEDLFILLYTSGSTGTPKGVRLTHGNLVCFVNWYQRYYKLQPEDCVGQYASYGFDACMMDMYSPLTCGAALCVIPEEIRLDLNAINEYLEKNRVTHQFMTTQVGRQFAVNIDNHSLKHLTVGGEKLVPLDPPTAYMLHNGYGPTECTIYATSYPVTKNEDNIPIGKPLDNMKAYVVDGDGHRVPVGALGELWFSGPQVGDGYLNLPEKTADVFIKNPFDSGKVYKTGDIVRYRADGNIEFFGRRDGQVKIRGFRIELSEVEAVIRQFPGVTDATVAAFDNESGEGKYLAGYVVGDKEIDIKALNDFIKSQKPPYMVPTVTMQIDKIPLNQNSKVNKRALPKPEFKAEKEAEDSSRPLNVMEQELCAMTGKIIGTENASLTTPLIYMGLDSIRSIQLATQIYKRLGVEIPSRRLLDGATLEDVENDIWRSFMSGKQEDRGARDVKITEASLSYPQMGVYYDCMKRPAEVLYNVPSLFTFGTDIDTQKLVRAVKAVVRAHPVLTAHFELGSSNVTQVCGSDEINVELMEMSDTELEASKKSFVKPFDLSKGPLCRFAIVRTSERVCLLTDFHHLVFDGASLNLFIKELAAALDGTYPQMEEYTYFDYVSDEKKFEQSPEFEENKKYFADMLSDFESASEITSDVSGKEEEGTMGRVSSPLDFKAASDFCKTRNVTPASLFLASTFYAVSRYVSDSRVYLSTISSGRSDVRTAETYGMFVNTLPLGIEIRNESAEEFVKHSAEVFDGAIRHEKYPFARIASDYGFVPNIMYEYQIGVMEEDGGLKRESLGLEVSKFKLAVHIEEREKTPCVALYYNDALYSENLMQSMARSIVIAAESIMAAPEKPIRSVELLDDERRAGLAKFREREYKPNIPADCLFHSGMERVAAERPEAIALIATDGSYTYKELDKNANMIANALIARGVRKGDRVVLLLPRRARFFFALFGVLKAGGVYIPCDPNYPAERVRHIVEDSDAPVIITTKDRLEGGRTIDIEELLKEQNTSRPDVHISQEDPAYMIYTSGSTGKPKGVTIAHKGLVNYVTDTPETILPHAMVNEGHVITAITTLSFDMAVKEFGIPLFNGLTVTVADEEQCNDASSLGRKMKETKTDLFQATPSRLLTLLEAQNFREALSQCRVIICAGEKYPQHLLQRLQTEYPEARIFNTYGPTEITVSSNVRELTRDNVVTVGRPLPGVKEFIVDSDGNELPFGVVGELYIGGCGVAIGYHNLPEMTAERFVEYRGTRVYKSGDYARWRDGGNVEILGRKDNQVKLRGLRIELGEVESAIAHVEGVKSVAVKINSIKGQDHLCAYFTADKPMDIAAIREKIGRTLTKYMIPTAWLQLDKMPMTPNGKTDLRALPEAIIERNVSETAANDAERAFCKIFGDILQLDNVGATEDFFSLGGTSLLVTRVMIEAEKVGYRVTFQDVFSRPTPRALAELFTDKAAKTEQTAKDKVRDYDYSKLQSVLDANTLESFKAGLQQPLGDILLTGATGYLGIHILRELLENYDGNVYCLLRSKGAYNAEWRLKGQLFYYFEKPYDTLLGKRLFVVEGDITKPIPKLPVSTVINCAAVVKHFSTGTEIEDANVGGVKNLIDYCLENNARLIQVSTMSTVSMGMSEGEYLENGRMIGERDLYFGQLLENKYVLSKFLAERLVLEAVKDKGLSAKIMRVGNLAARYSDGEFQINNGMNSAMGRLKIYALLGVCPYEQMDVPMEFSPIDEVAKAILLLCQTPKECVIFHPYNHNAILSGNVFGEMEKLGLPVKPVEREDFDAAMAKAGDDPVKAKLLTSMLAYQSGNKHDTHIARHNTYTMQTLYRMGYRWPVTSWDYVAQFIGAIKGLGFFDF